jgi:antitoxin HicB
MQRTYKILMHKEPEGTYTVSVPALPGCITYGETVEHSMLMVKEAIELYIEELKERGEDISDNSNTLECSLSLQTA